MTKMIRAAVVACLIACVVAVASAKAKGNLVQYTFDEGAYITDLVEYTENPCEEYWVSGSYTVGWDGHDGQCDIAKETVAAARAGDTRFTASQRATILKWAAKSATRRGSPVAILD